MTGAELLKARYLLGIDQTSCAALMGAKLSGTTNFTATDIQTAEGNLNTLTNSDLNTAAEKFLRPMLNLRQGV